jgi:CheY-like chemotaxis protein/HPt (histidine-containing phosphotransfer) domain-containing protein
VAAVQSSAELLLSTINDVLDFSKIEAGRLEVAAGPVELRPLVETTMDIVAPLASGKRLDLVHHVADDVPEVVTTDGHRVRQVLVNLLTNGVKFTESGEVALLVSRVTDEGGAVGVVFEVRDTGIGISDDARDRLFRSFSQVDASISRRYGGTGLGLAISARIVELLGGGISVTSEVGVGSRFTFWLPATDAAAATTPPTGAEASVLDGRTVLIADHNDTERRQLGDLVGSWRMAPLVAASADEALALLDRARVDVVLVDEDLAPTGFAALAARLRPGGDGPRGVLLSRLGAHDDRHAGRPAWSGAVVTRPVKRSTLHDALVKVLVGDVTAIPPAPGSAALDPGFADAHPMRLLVAEDNPTNQRLLVKLLDRLGYTAAVVGDGAAAVDAVGGGGYDVVLMDVQMPNVDGLEATRRIRTVHGPEPYVVAVTANATADDVSACLAAGMDAHLAKPIRPDALTAALRAAAAVAARAPVADPVPAPEVAVLDEGAFDRLLELSGDPQFVRELIAEFRTELVAEVDALHADLPRSMADVRRHAHSIKSSAANVGAAALSAQAASVEAAARSGDRERVVTLLAELGSLAAATDAALAARGDPEAAGDR